MAQQFYYGIDAYLLLIQEWVNAAFPRPRKDEDEEATLRLNGIWSALANALCNFDTKKIVLFYSERRKLALAGREGDPPIHAIERQLRAAEQAGIQEGFLAVAMREATEYLIARDLPAALNHWTQLADQIVPKEMWFSMRGDQTFPSKVTYGPDM